MRPARHLVDDVGVPAILGFRSGTEIIDLAEGLLIERRVLVVASLTSNPLITRLPQPSTEPRLVWRTTFAFNALAEATAHLVHEALEPRTARGGRTRVVFVRDDAVGTLAFADTFYKQLVLNGKPALDSGEDYQEITMGGRSPDEIARVADRIRGVEPTIVVLLLPGEELGPLALLVETRSETTRRPTYVVVNGDTSPLASFVGKSADRRHRVFSVLSPSNSTPNARFVIRYNQDRHEPVSRAFNPGTSYDAFYLLAYGTFALGADGPITGSSIARAFARLVPPGKAIEVGPPSVLDALGVLSSGGQVDLEGTASGLDFDLTTGEAPSDFVLLSPAIGKDGTPSGEDIESGPVYRATAHHSEGSVH
jgi:ABC-type branched-subunit amino acid transport system substrate-binding protein